MADFMIRALFAGIGVACLTGPLGTFIVWRRMAYFGETLAHSALLGAALGILIGIDITLSVLVLSALLVLVLAWMQKRASQTEDTLLGMTAHASLALGYLLLSISNQPGVDPLGFLFGDLLAVGTSDLLWIYGAVIVVGWLLFIIWPKLVSISLHAELARVEGVDVNKIRLLFMLMVAISVAIAMKIVGVLLITALLIIPAAGAKNLAHTPEQMALFATIIGIAAVLLGSLGSLYWDLPTGPAIIMAATLLYIISQIVVNNLDRKRQGQLQDKIDF